MHVTTFSQLKLNPSEHNLPVTEKTHWKKSSILEQGKSCVSPIILTSFLHAKLITFQWIQVSDNDLADRWLGITRQEGRIAVPNVCLQALTFSLPSPCDFSPFPQTGSLFTGSFYVGMPHQSCGGWTLFFYSNTFFCYNKFASALYINLWIFAICTSPIIHFVCQPPLPPPHSHHHPHFFITYGFNFLWVSQSSQEKLKTILMQNFGA